MKNAKNVFLGGVKNRLKIDFFCQKPTKNQLNPRKNRLNIVDFFLKKIDYFYQPYK